MKKSVLIWNKSNINIKRRHPAEIPKYVQAVIFKSFSLFPVLTQPKTINCIIFIITPEKPCPAEKAIIKFMGKKLTSAKKPPEHRALTIPIIKTTAPVTITLAVLSFSMTKTIVGSNIMIIVPAIKPAIRRNLSGTKFLLYSIKNWRTIFRA